MGLQSNGEHGTTAVLVCEREEDCKNKLLQKTHNVHLTVEKISNGGGGHFLHTKEDINIL